MGVCLLVELFLAVLSVLGHGVETLASLAAGGRPASRRHVAVY
jgi:hypothetical protein